MDHMYAATSSASGEDVITPPPILSPHLWDHNMAQPPSESPQAASSSHTHDIDNQSSETRSSALKSRTSSENKSPVKHKQTMKTRKMSSEQSLKTGETVEVEESRKRRKSRSTQGQHVEIEMAAEDNQPAKRRRLNSKQYQLLETEASVEQDQTVKAREMTNKQDHSNTRNLVTGQPSGTREMDLKQDRMATNTENAVSRQDVQQLTTKDSKPEGSKKIQMADSKQSPKAATSSKIASEQDSEEQGSSRNKTKLTAKDKTLEKVNQPTEVDVCEERLAKTEELKKSDGPEDIEILSNGKNTDASETTNQPVMKRKRGRPRKKRRKNVNVPVKDSVPVAASESVEESLENEPEVIHILSESAEDSSLSSPPQRKENLTFHEPQKRDEYSLLRKSLSLEDKSPPHTTSEVGKASNAGDEGCLEEVADLEGTANSESIGASGLVGHQEPSQHNVEDGSTPVTVSNSPQRRNLNPLFVSGDSNSSAPQQEETKSPDSLVRRLYLSSLKSRDSEDGGGEKTGSDAEDSDASYARYKRFGGKYIKSRPAKPNSKDAVDTNQNRTEVENQDKHSERVGAEGDRKESTADNSSTQKLDSAHDGDGVSESNASSLDIVKFCAVVNLTPKVPKTGSSVPEAAHGKKQTAGEADKVDTSKSPILGKSPFRTPLLASSLSSTPSESPVQHSSRRPGKKLAVPRADTTESPSCLEKYRIPLRDHGWRRELVVRGVYDDVKSKYPPADVYYFTPDGKKLRSGVMISTYLSENSSALTPENFTFMKKIIFEEPWEIVRHAGKGGIPKKSSSDASSTENSPLKKKMKAKIPKTLSNAATKLLVSSEGISSSPTETRSTVSATKKRRKQSFRAIRDDSDPEVETEDEDYCPWKEETSPDWKKRRTFSDARKPKGPKGTKQPQTSPRREVLIQSIPEPEIIIDRADESLCAEEYMNNEDNRMDMNAEEDQRIDAASKSPRMMLLPVDVKEEGGDSEEDDSDASKHSTSRFGTVHIPPSPQMQSKMKVKPTARKSTMPRIALKKKLSKPKETIPPQEDGQLCSNACPGLNGQSPSLQCSVCMCLFHHVCVNVDPKKSLPGTFKCLRCKNVVTTGPSCPSSLPSKPSPVATTSVVTSSFTAPVSSAPSFPKLIVLRTPPSTSSSGTLSPLQTLTSPLITSVPTSMLPVTSEGNINAIQLLRNLTNLSQQPPPTPTPIPVRPAPLSPPQLVRGGATPPGPRPFGYRVIPALQSRPPPRLTAAPGMVPPAPQATPPLIVPPPSAPAARPVLPVGAQVQHQMMTLPTSIQNRLNLSQPLSVKLSNTQVLVPPSCLISTKDGLKVLLPPSTFSVPPNTKLSLSFTDSAPVTTVTPSLLNLPPASVETRVIGASSPAVTTLASQNTSSSGGGGGKTPLVGTSGASSPSRVAESRSSPETVLVSDDSDTSEGLSAAPDTLTEGSQEEGTEGSVRRGSGNKRRVDFTRCAIHRLFGGFDCMLAIFEYLTIPDLLRAGKVCQTWHRITRTSCLWQKVNLQGLQVKNWLQAAHFLNSVQTRILNLQNIQPEMEEHSERMEFWDCVKDSVTSLMGLQHLEFGLVPVSILHSITRTLQNLEVLIAKRISDLCRDEMWTQKTQLDVGIFGGLSKLQELRLRGTSSLTLPSSTLSGTLFQLAKLKHLHTLSLTSLCALRDHEFSFLSDMVQLQVLELGDCLQWTEKTYKVVGELSNLHHLRLECGGNIPDCGLADALTNLTKLKRLELILFTIPASVSKALSKLPLLKTLIVWPNACHALSPALVNSHALTAVAGLRQLTTLEWGVVLRPSAQDSPGHQPSTFPPTTIPLLQPDTTLDPEVKPSREHILDMSVNDFTKTLLATLPRSTTIKVFNTQVVDRGPT